MANRKYVMLEDKNGEEVLPVTDGNGVFVDDGTKKLDKKLTEINEQLEHKAKQIDLEVVKNRIDSITSLESGSTTGDAELIDGRIGTNGNIFNNIGSSIRNQLKFVTGELTTFKANTTISFMQGTLNSENGEYNSSRRDRICTDFIESKNIGIIAISGEFKFLIMQYDSNKTYLHTTNFLNTSTIDTSYFYNNCKYLRIVVAYREDDTTVIKPSVDVGLLLTEKIDLERLTLKIKDIESTINKADTVFNNNTSIEITDIKSIPSLTGSDCCTVGDAIYTFLVSDDSGEAKANAYKLTLSDDKLTKAYVYEHDLGHCNSLEYCEANDTLILGNGSSDYELPGKILILENFSEKTSFLRSECLQIDVSHLGKKANVVWGENNYLNYDIIYLLLNDGHKIVKIQLGKESNILESGTKIKDVGFNGTYKVLNTYTISNVTEDYDNCVQGATYFKNKLIWGFGHSEGTISLHIAEFKDSGVVLSGVNYFKYDNNGNKIKETVLGVTNNNNELIVQTGRSMYYCNIN